MSFDTTQSDAAARDRRRFTRHEVCTEARIEPLNGLVGGEGSVTVSICDIGRTGLMFQSALAIRPGSTWRLWLLHRGQLFTSVPVIVRYCRPAEGSHQVGVQFMLEAFFLERLGVSPVELEEDELRQEDRFRGVASAQYVEESAWPN